MKSLLNHSIKVLATGFVVLLLLSLLLFWGRWLYENNLHDIMPRESSYVTITPSILVPSELENDPNVSQHSEVRAWMRFGEPTFPTLGISNYFVARMPEGYNSNIYYYHKDEVDEDWILFDEKTGQINCHYTYRERISDNTYKRRQVQLYVGPEGVSETADRTLGRFTRPIVDTSAFRLLILYDKTLRRFFKINLREKTVTKGPELGKDDTHKPIQIGRVGKNSSLLSLYWNPPFLKAPDEGSNHNKAIVTRGYLWEMQRYLLVLDETGRIDLLDKETLKFAGTAGHLPVPESLFPSKRTVTPKDLLAYELLPLALSTDHKYRGMYVASINREGTATTLAVFDEEGKLIRQKNTDFTDVQRHHGISVPTSKAIFWEVPWAPTFTIAKYLLENLHPPILSLTSYAMADNIEATAGHRALFILPNSFIAMKGRDVRSNTTERFFTAMLLILPSIILSICLAWRVSINAAVVGLSENARIFWILASICFGLAAYITYRLTLPGITLVTCANCGKLRRPDMEKCHRCGSKWHVPELIPPTWRVLDT
jgi:hypothetical protein